MTERWKKARKRHKALTAEQDPYQKKAHRGLLDTLEEHYNKSNNPLHAWEAFQTCREFGMPPPNWVLNYFDRIADNLETFRDREHITPRDLGELFELTKPGRGTAFSSLSDLPRRVAIARSVAEAVEGGQKEYIAWRDVAKKYGLRDSVVRKYYKSYWG